MKMLLTSTISQGYLDLSDCVHDLIKNLEDHFDNFHFSPNEITLAIGIVVLEPKFIPYMPANFGKKRYKKEVTIPYLEGAVTYKNWVEFDCSPIERESGDTCLIIKNKILDGIIDRSRSVEKLRDLNFDLDSFCAEIVSYKENIKN